MEGQPITVHRRGGDAFERGARLPTMKPKLSPRECRGQAVGQVGRISGTPAEHPRGPHATGDTNGRGMKRCSLVRGWRNNERGDAGDPLSFHPLPVAASRRTPTSGASPASPALPFGPRTTASQAVSTGLTERSCPKARLAALHHFMPCRRGAARPRQLTSSGASAPNEPSRRTRRTPQEERS